SPDACAFARRNSCARLALPNRFVTEPLIIRAVRAHLLDFALYVGEQFRQHLGVADVIGASTGYDDFARRGVHAKMKFAPSAPLAPAVLADFPLAFAVDFDAGRVNHQLACAGSSF